MLREELLSYVQGHGNGEQVRNLLEGVLDKDNLTPLQSVNYLESHDDYALVDRFRNIHNWGLEDTLPDEVVSRVMIAMGLLMVAPGVPMMSAGQDFLRHKCGVRNTYQQGDLNALDYERIELYKKEATFIRKLIQLRQSNPGQRARQSGKSEWETCFFSGDSSQIIVFGWINVLNKQSYLVLANTGKESHKLELPSPFDQIVKTLLVIIRI